MGKSMLPDISCHYFRTCFEDCRKGQESISGTFHYCFLLLGWWNHWRNL